MPAASIVNRTVLVISGGGSDRRSDAVVAEEPLELRLAEHGQEPRVFTVTMRTPGHDPELAVGLLLAEGVIRRLGDVARIQGGDSDARGDRMTVFLAAGVRAPELTFARNQMATSACGLCGKSDLDALQTAPERPLPAARPTWRPAVVAGLTDALRAAQPVFDATGGLHGAALADVDGGLHLVREDVGRHNAVDKVIGARLLAGEAASSDVALVVSGRAGFELVQKAVMAGVPAMVAVGAPSSRAIELAEQTGLTLVGFARQGRFTVYAGAARLIG